MEINIIKKALLTLMMLVLIPSIFSESIDFRGFNFNSSLEKIIEKEGEPDEVAKKTEENNLDMFGDTWVVYKDKKVAGYLSTIQIELLKNKLISGTYLISTKQKELLPDLYDPVEYSKIYNDLYNKLSKIYGSPSNSNNIEQFDSPISGLYAKSVINMAPYKAIWEKDNGSIILMLNYQKSWSLLLIYMNNDLYKKLFGKNNETEGL